VVKAIIRQLWWFDLIELNSELPSMMEIVEKWNQMAVFLEME
jgi:hypothetical protein